jgi:hypothetical protein
MIPSGYQLSAHHVSWGTKTTMGILKNGIPSMNIPFHTTHGFFVLCKHIYKYTMKKQIGLYK